MKQLILLFILSIILISCGKANQVSSNNIITGNNPIQINPSSFIGVYDITRVESENCGVSIRIVGECNGLRILSNNSGPEDFCNINRGEIISRDRTSITVTHEGKRLQSIVKIYNDGRTTGGRITFSNVLLLNSNGTELTKLSTLKNRISRCIYQKR